MPEIPDKTLGDPVTPIRLAPQEGAAVIPSNMDDRAWETPQEIQERLLRMQVLLMPSQL